MANTHTESKGAGKGKPRQSTSDGGKQVLIVED